MKRSSGFTTIELLVIIAIIGVISAAAVPSYQAMRNNVSLSSYTQEIVSALRLAQNRSLSSHEGTTHGVHFETDEYIVYGGSWAAQTYSQSHALDNGIQVISGAPGDVEFERLTGRTTALTLVIGYPSGKQKTITIDSSGRISSI